MSPTADEGRGRPSSERSHGAVTGLAVGDALGAAVEFLRPGEFAPLTGMRASLTHNTPVGAFTDDASTALCLAWSLIEHELELNTTDQMNRYVEWYRDGAMSSTGECFDIGLGTRAALDAFIADGDPDQGRQMRKNGGAGALARLAPVVIGTRAGDDVVERAIESTLTTHGAPEALDAARWFALLLREALLAPLEADPEEIKDLLLGRELLERHGQGDHPWHPSIERVIDGSYSELEADEIIDLGYVVSTLESALWAFWSTGTFAEGMLAAANLGRDSDTRCAVYGQLAGAVYGDTAIPTEWREQLIMAEQFREVTDRLLALV